MAVSARILGLLALLALVPVSIYLVLSGQPDVVSFALGVINVVLITTMLFVLFGDATETASDGTAH